MNTDSPVPDRLGPYRIDGPLAAGGMGQVYRAYDERLERAVAIKRVLAERTNDPVSRQRLRREAKAVAALNHPAVVQIHDLLETADGDWLVMELVPGRNLRQLLHAQELNSIPDILAIAEQIVDGLAAAHDQGIIHRDLKDANVMVTPSRQVKLLDFGIAKQVRSTDTTLSQPGTLLGTVHTMSPEQAMGLAIDARSDLFSFGALLYQMLSGVPPFLAETTSQTLARVCSYQPPPLQEVSPQVPATLSQLVDDLLQKDPLHRPQSARQVAIQLQVLCRQLEAATRVQEDVYHGPPAAANTVLSSRTLQDSPPTQDTALLNTPAVPEDTISAAATALHEDGKSAEDRIAPGQYRQRQRLAIVLIPLVLAATFAASLVSPSVRLILRGWLGGASDTATALTDPANLSSAELYQEGMALLLRFDREGNVDLALELFQHLLERDPNSATGQAGLARAYWRRFRGGQRDPVFLEQAATAAEQAVVLDSFLADAWVSRGLVYLTQGRHDAAVADLRAALELEPTNADAYWGLGRIHQVRGQAEAAMVAFQAAIERRPDDRMLYDALGALYYRHACYIEAEAAFQKSIEIAPDSFYGYRSLAAVYHMQGRYPEAAALVQQALRIQASPTLYSSLGTLLFAQGQYAKAVSAFEKALESGGHQYLYWNNLGDALRWSGNRHAEAREAYRQTLRLLDEEIQRQPQDATMGSRRAVVLAKLGQSAQALAEQHRVDGLAGLDAHSHFRAAVTYEVCGEREAALERLLLALEAGFSLPEIERDPELTQLRVDPAYHRLVLDFEGRPGYSGSGSSGSTCISGSNLKPRQAFSDAS